MPTEEVFYYLSKHRQVYLDEVSTNVKKMQVNATAKHASQGVESVSVIHKCVSVLYMIHLTKSHYYLSYSTVSRGVIQAGKNPYGEPSGGVVVGR